MNNFEFKCIYEKDIKLPPFLIHFIIILTSCINDVYEDEGNFHLKL